MLLSVSNLSFTHEKRKESHRIEQMFVTNKRNVNSQNIR